MMKLLKSKSMNLIGAFMNLIGAILLIIVIATGASGALFAWCVTFIILNIGSIALNLFAYKWKKEDELKERRTKIVYIKKG